MYTAEASVVVQANPNTTWAYVSNYKNFDKFMSNVNEVKMLDSQQSEWHMSGPLGIPVSWKAMTTETNAPSRLAWKSIEGSLENDGFISVAPEGNGSRVTVHINYNPPLGAIGEFVATLFKDPQAMLEHDLMQLDALISTGDASIDRAFAVQFGFGLLERFAGGFDPATVATVREGGNVEGILVALTGFEPSLDLGVEGFHFSS